MSAWLSVILPILIGHSCEKSEVAYAGAGLKNKIVWISSVAGLARALREILTVPQRSAEMGRRSLDIINRWGFEEDVQELRAALGSFAKTQEVN